MKLAYDKLIELTDVLGIDTSAAEDDGIPAEVMDMVNQRVEAKKAKNYALADELRNKVMEMGYTIKDTPNGPQVEKA